MPFCVIYPGPDEAIDLVTSRGLRRFPRGIAVITQPAYEGRTLMEQGLERVLEPGATVTLDQLEAPAMPL